MQQHYKNILHATAVKNSSFRFKQFTIEQSRCAMKVGTDSVLLGAWCRVDGIRHALDIGTGTGVIALMIAQRTPTSMIDAVEIDADACAQAAQNAAASPFTAHIHLHHADVREFACTHLRQYDFVICNPPFFTNALKCPDHRRTLARHNDTLNNTALITAVTQLLTPDGRFNVILPTALSDDFQALAEQQGLTLTRHTTVHTTAKALPKRVLMELTAGTTETCRYDTLAIATANTDFTDDYRRLTRDFYLNFK